jgi:NAD(P)-dependent dehydrogenase (short-subunit alcohol dehydrogenase family)
VVITGASRGIGLAIGLRCAQDGANVAILAKTIKPQPNLPGKSLITQGPFIQLPRRFLKQEAKLFLCNVILEVRKV